MNPQPTTTPAAPLARRPTAAERQRSHDERWNQQMTRLMREAADVRERRERTRASEDDRSARREAAAMLELIRTYDRPHAGRDPRS